MFGKRPQHKGELIIPPIAAQDPSAKEIVRGCVAEGAFHVSLEMVWTEPAAWGVAFADLARHLGDAYHSARGLNKEETIKQIIALLHVELDAPTDTPSGHIVE